MQVVDVNAFHTQVAQAPVELVFEELRGHAMAALHDFVGFEDAGLDVLAVEIFVGVGGHRPVGREISAFRAENEFVARKALLRELLESGADAALAALEAVVHGCVDNVDAVLDGGHHRCGVTTVRLVIRLAEVGANAQRGQRQRVDLTKMTGGCQAPESIGISFGAFGGGLHVDSCEDRSFK